MSVAEEIREVVAVLHRAQEAGVDVRELGERWRARALAMEAAPAGAGWEWLAAQGDEAAARAVELGRGRP